jgi:hypothetical protein
MRSVLRSVSPRRSFLTWFLIGTAAAAILQVGQTRVMGGVPEGLLFAGNWQEVHVLVAEELPATPIFEGYGHDGQIFYAVGLDLLGESVPDILLSAPYRYRRILFPAAASGFGLLDWPGLLWGMIALSAASVGAAAGAVALLAGKLGLPFWAPLVVILNPSTWLSARLLTADNMALALGLGAIAAFLYRRDSWTVALLAAAALTKEPYLAIALGLGGYSWFRGERWRASRLVVGATVPILLWWGYIAAMIGSPFDSGGNVVGPFAGIAAAVAWWPRQELRDMFYLAAALAGFLASSWVLVRGPRLWSWLVGPWLLIAVLSADLVWHVGNNAIRALGPLFTLGILGIMSCRVELQAQTMNTSPSRASP